MKQFDKIGFKILISFGFIIASLLYYLLAFFTGEFILFKSGMEVEDIFDEIGAICIGIFIHILLGLLLYGILKWFKWIFEGERRNEK